MLRQSVQSSKPRKVGLVIVHGVGEAEAGYCLDAVAAKLQSRKLADGTPAYEFTSYSDCEKLPERLDGKSEDGTAKFPVFSRQGLRADGTRISAVELFWADTTTLLPGRMNTLLGFFRVIFESQHIVHAMLDRGGDIGARISRYLLLVAAWLLRGPIAALTIAVSVFCGLLLFEPDIVRLTDNAHWKFLMVQAALCAGAVYGFFYFVVRHRELAWYDLIFWLFLCTVVLIGLDLNGVLLTVLSYVPTLKTPEWISHFLNSLPWWPKLETAAAVEPDCRQMTNADGCYVGGLYKIIIWLWRVWGVIVLLAVGVLIAAWMRASRKSDRAVVSAIATSAGVLILQFLLWTTVVVSVLYPMLNRAESNAALNQLLDAVPNKEALEGYIGSLYEQTHNPLLVTTREFLHLADVHPDWIFRFKFIYVISTVTLLLFVMGAGLIMQRRRAWAFTGLEGLSGAALEAKLHQNAKRMPRLLFNKRLVLVLIASFLSVMALIYWQSLLEFNPVFVNFRSIFLPVAALIALLVPMAFGPWITNVVHIARDLIDHHYRPTLETAATFLPSRMKPQEGMPRRERIQNRLLAVLDRYFRDAGCSDVVFLAHSQGSLVVYDYLRNAAGNYPALGGAQPAFISCGSPLGTIYQTYFYEYGKGNPNEHGHDIRVKRWINIFRVDDYIGGAVIGPPGVAFSNKILPPGEHRHMYYWNEDAVADALDAFIAGVAAPDTPAKAPAPDMAVKRQMPLLWQPQGVKQSS